MRSPTVLDGVLISSGMILILAGAVGLVLLVRRAGRVGALARVGLVLGGAGTLPTTPPPQRVGSLAPIIARVPSSGRTETQVGRLPSRDR